MADATAQPGLPLLPDRFIGKAIPGPGEPFEYPSALELDDGGTKGGSGAGSGEPKAETSYEKCRTFLVQSDKARAEEWKDGIGTQLLVVSDSCVLPAGLNSPPIGLSIFRRHDCIHHRGTEKTGRRPCEDDCRFARTAHQADESKRRAAEYGQQPVHITIFARRSRQRALVYQPRPQPYHRHHWAAMPTMDSRVQQARRPFRRHGILLRPCLSRAWVQTLGGKSHYIDIATSSYYLVGHLLHRSPLIHLKSDAKNHRACLRHSPCDLRTFNLHNIRSSVRCPESK